MLMGGHHHGHVQITESASEASQSDENDAEASLEKARGNKAKIKKDFKPATTDDTSIMKEQRNEPPREIPEHSFGTLIEESDWGTLMLPCDHVVDALEKIDSLKEMSKKMMVYEERRKDRKACLGMGIPECVLNEHSKFEGVKGEVERRKNNDKLMHISLKTAFAIALHNFPEGLATFVAALGDPRMGVVLAIGVAIHNIPEGLVVALPMYYATGNRTKAFLCGALSGCTEIFAALLGWAVLANAFSATIYGVVFGIVSGMMVIISIRELLPTAHQYDPQDKYVTLSFVGGMMVMALSLALLVLV
jgi:zinc transporter ZupT